jgi:single-strand DNA-binding protein
MSYDNSVTIVGNLVHDPELKFLNDGKAVVSFTIAVNREINGEKYVSYFDCSAWGSLAENISNTLHKGDRTVLFGSLTQRTFERKDGSKGSAVELKVSEAGPSLQWASAAITRNPKS